MRGYIAEHPLVRFERSFRIDGECWIWTGLLDSNGYGRLFVNAKYSPTGKDRSVRAHRWGYEYMRGAIPKGLVLDHLCQNPSCVNPEHLEVVTQRVNVLRGRGFAAINSVKTHCPEGHAYTEENTFGDKRRPNRQCRTCHNIKQNARRKRNPAMREWMKKYLRLWRRKHPNYMREWHKRNAQ